MQDTVETLIGGQGADNITAGDGDNTLIGGPGNDVLNGGAGNDLFLEMTVAMGSDVMNGGPGVDTVDYSERARDLTISLCISNPTSCATGSRLSIKVAYSPATPPRTSSGKFSSIRFTS